MAPARQSAAGLLLAVCAVLVATSVSGCPAGRFGVRKNTNKPCFKCPVGTFAPANSTACQKCPKNTFAAEIGSAKCTRCPRGSVTKKRGSSKCIPKKKLTPPAPPVAPPPPSKYNCLRKNHYKHYRFYDRKKVDCRSQPLPKNTVKVKKVLTIKRDGRKCDYFYSIFHYAVRYGCIPRSHHPSPPVSPPIYSFPPPPTYGAEARMMLASEEFPMLEEDVDDEDAATEQLSAVVPTGGSCTDSSQCLSQSCYRNVCDCAFCEFGEDCLGGCAAPLACIGKGDATGNYVCGAKLAEGIACSSDSMCESGNCEDDVCTAQRPAGGPCVAHTQCLSGTCHGLSFCE